MFPISRISAIIFLEIATFGICSNIDTSYPIILKNSADGADSLFGTTVQLLSKDGQYPGIIIGAPKANSTLPKHMNIKEPGVLWQCSLDVSTGTGNACRVLVMDPTGNEETAVNVRDRKDEGWLGGTMTKSSNHFVSCASRWSNNFDPNTYYMNGICMLRSKRELFDDFLPEPSVNKSRLLPLIASGEQGNNGYSMGQAGFSAHITPNDELVLGAPGVNNGKGTIIRYSPSAGGEFTNETILFTDQKVQNSSYLGFSLSSGYFVNTTNTKNTNQQYVTGVPRADDLLGKVLIFQFPNEKNGTMDILIELVGTQVGAYFGSSIAVVDINGDGYDDLIIGAPRHSVEQSKWGIAKKSLDSRREGGYGDEGAVFIYISDGVRNNPHLSITMTPQRVSWLTGSDQPGSQFGTAIANLGDIDNDGSPDIAIGAPYDNNGKGVVYIYKGGTKGLQRTPAQTIQASEIDSSLRGFGYSISPAEDVDNNGYNDLAVGAYDSGHAVLLRTRTLVNITGVVVSNLNKLTFDTKTFEIQSCVSYSGDQAPEKLDLLVTISADVDTRPRPHRVVLHMPEQPDSAAPNHIYQEEVFRDADAQACTKFIAVVTMPLETSGRPVTMRQSITIAESRGTTGPTVYEIKESGGSVRTDITGLGYKAFCKNCPLVDELRSKIKDLSLPLAVACGSDDRCISNLQLDVASQNLQNDATFLIGSYRELPIEITVKNLAETAISPAIIVTWQKNIELRKVPSECQYLKSNETSQSYKCSLGRTLELGLSAKVQLEFNTYDLVAGSQKDLWFHIEATTFSETLGPSETTLIIPLTVDADITVNGDESLSTFNPTTGFPDIHFYQSFAVYLHGITSIAGANMKFHIPKSFTTKSGTTVKINVYEADVGQATVTRGNGNIRCFPTKGSYDSKPKVDLSSRMIKSPAADPDYNYDTEESDNNGTLAIGGIFRQKVDDKTKLSKVDGFQIECKSDSVECLEVQCTTGLFLPKIEERINFPMSISTSSLRNVLGPRKLNLIKILSEGWIEIVAADTNLLPKSIHPDDTIALTVIQLDMQKVPNWVYVISFMVGLILLCIVAFCLYWCGCFKRNRKPGYEEANKDGTEYETLPLQASSRHSGEDAEDESDNDVKRNNKSSL